MLGNLAIHGMVAASGGTDADWLIWSITENLQFWNSKDFATIKPTSIRANYCIWKNCMRN